MKFEFDEDFDKRLLTTSGVALAAYAVGGAAAPAKLHELYMEPVRHLLDQSSSWGARAARPKPYCVRRRRCRCRTLSTTNPSASDLPCPTCPQTEALHEPSLRCEFRACNKQTPAVCSKHQAGGSWLGTAHCCPAIIPDSPRPLPKRSNLLRVPRPDVTMKHRALTPVCCAVCHSLPPRVWPDRGQCGRPPAGHLRLRPQHQSAEERAQGGGRQLAGAYGGYMV